MSAGESAAFFLGPVPSDKLPKDAIPGRVLTGTLTLGLLAHKTEPAPQAAQVAGRRTATACLGLSQAFPSLRHVAVHPVRAWQWREVVRPPFAGS